MTSTYSQTLNGSEVRLAQLEPDQKGSDGVKWATFGKQNWRCGMNQTPG